MRVPVPGKSEPKQPKRRYIYSDVRWQVEVVPKKKELPPEFDVPIQQDKSGINLKVTDSGKVNKAKTHEAGKEENKDKENITPNLQVEAASESQEPISGDTSEETAFPKKVQELQTTEVTISYYRDTDGPAESEVEVYSTEQLIEAIKDHIKFPTAEGGNSLHYNMTFRGRPLIWGGAWFETKKKSIRRVAGKKICPRGL